MGPLARACALVSQAASNARDLFCIALGVFQSDRTDRSNPIWIGWFGQRPFDQNDCATLGRPDVPHQFFQYCSRVLLGESLLERLSGSALYYRKRRNPISTPADAGATMSPLGRVRDVGTKRVISSSWRRGCSRLGRAGAKRPRPGWS